MSIVKLYDQYLKDIADAIRLKTGISGTITPANMASYVPNSYTAGDEGKVVSNGVLVAQGSQTITQNGTFDTTLISEIVANISGGGGSVNILSGTEAPTASVGEDGDLYLQYLHVQIESGIPSGYTQLNYVRFSGAQSFDTGISVNTSDLRIVSKLKLASVNTRAIWGGSWSASGYFLMIYNGVFRWHSGGVSVDVSANESEWYEIETNKTELILNGVEHALPAHPGTDSNVNFSIGHVYNAQGSSANMYLERTKMYSGSSLIADFIPCKDGNDVACFYDLARGTTYYSQTTTHLVAGDALIDLDSEIESSYCKVNGVWRNLIGTNINDVNTGGNL